MEISNEYWAGLFDGEGSVSITNTLRPSITISQNKKAILFLAQSQFGGGVKEKDKCGKCSMWVLNKAEDLENFLNEIYPHSIIKKNEIEIALKILPLIRKGNKGCNPLSEEEKAIRLSYRRNLQSLKLNKRFEDRPSFENLYREKVKKAFNNRCCDCGMDLNNNPFYAIINKKNNKLYCRRCHAVFYSKNRERKPRSRKEIESAIETSKTIVEAYGKLGISKATFYHKKKALGIK